VGYRVWGITQLFTWRKRRFVRRTTLQASQTYTITTTPSHKTAKYSQSIGVSSPVVFSNIVSVPISPPRRYDTDSQLQFVYFGRVFLEKNLRFVVRAFAKVVAASLRPVHLRIIGKGSEERWVLRRIAWLHGISQYVDIEGEYSLNVTDSRYIGDLLHPQSVFVYAS